MLMSAIEGADAAAFYPELAGKRVLITGLSKSVGVDIARAFAEHKTRLVLHFSERSAETQAIAEIVATQALDVRMFDGIGSAADDVVHFTRAAVQAFAGLDAVINLASLSAHALPTAAEHGDIETSVSELLLLPCLVSQIAANRMRLTLNEGLILNVATLGPKPTASERAYASVARAALASMTRRQAEEWANEGIRINAIAPQVAGPAQPGIAGETGAAALALYLASGRGKSLSGHIFDAEGEWRS
ncbi:MAG: SDR family NAD(P)-dependent oxidoreductase [Hyphomicrobiaceae bacterium]|jgi:3-oxoacyl-[acyl-carrier protein] reductase